MAKHLNAFGLQVADQVIGAPIGTVEREIRFAAIEFCDYTFTWRLDLDAVDLVADQADYEFVLPDDSRIVTVLYVGQDGLKVLPTTMITMDSQLDGWRRSTSVASRAAYYYLPDRTKVRLTLTPEASSTGALSLMVALKPTQEARVLPDILFDDNLEAMRHGALGRLMAMPRFEWSNPQLAAYHKGEFERLKKKEKAERYNDYTRTSSLTIRPPNYGGRTRRGYPYDDEDC
jgi:hypothetical protein